MARQENTCWHCGTEWASADELRTTLRLIPGDAHQQVEDAARWTNEGGSCASEVAVAATRSRSDSVGRCVRRVRTRQQHEYGGPGR
jgi:hypothetical protein